MKIGYQGILGSNSEIAAKKFTKILNISNPEYVPLVTSRNVVNAIMEGTVDLGVMATMNTTAGEVIETKVAIRNKPLKKNLSTRIPIHHCLFVKNMDMKIGDINCIISHSQALKQCARNLNNLFHNVKQVPIADTAIGAYNLKLGKYNSCTGVLCTKNAGVINGLHLLYKNIEDSKNNITEFALFEKTLLRPMIKV